MQQNPYQKYMQQNVTTMTPGQLVVALYDKAITELNKAVYFIEEEPSIPKAHNSITRVADMVVLATLIRANVKKDAKLLKELIPFFQEIRDAFAEASKGF